MKKLIVILAALVSSIAFAGQVVDSVNFFGPRVTEVAVAIENKPVWVYAVESVSSTGIKATADELAKQHPNSFAVVLTTHPREWRVSMNPIGLASSESVRQAGEVMVAGLKRGDLAGSVIRLSNELVRLSRKGSVEQTTPTPRKVEPPTVALIQEESHVWWWIGGGVLVALIGGFSIAWLIDRNREKKETALREKRERARADSETSRMNREQSRAEGAQSRSTPRDDRSRTEKARKAQQFYDGYTQGQRQALDRQYCSHPNYRSGIMDDPLLFYWFMTSINQPTQAVYYGLPQGGYSTPARSYGAPDPTPSPRYEPQAPSSSYDTSSSSSDSSGGGGSCDSGSSSSDSSGGGGSW